MSNIDEIVSRQSNTRQFDKNAWKEKKAQQRNEAYELIDKTSTDIVQDSNKFKSYIDIQSRFDKYSVGNALLIFAQKPNATIIKDFENWKKEIGDNFKINSKEKGIIILEPGEIYTKADGSQAQSFNTKSVFDITQTNVKDTPKTNNYDETILLKALLKDSPVAMKVVDSLDNGKIADWNKADDTNTRQVVGFYPDVNRYKEFNLVATAHSPFGSTVIDTKNYKIVIFDPNWDNGKNQLRLFLNKIKNNDSNSN
jgi:hypothetical protein